jgi:hypothetical protein
VSPRGSPADGALDIIAATAGRSLGAPVPLEGSPWQMGPGGLDGCDPDLAGRNDRRERAARLDAERAPLLVAIGR